MIPTLNAAATLPATLAALGPVADCIVVDGGSHDTTIGVATQAGARVLSAPRGRGRQLAVGIDAATQAWLLLLHADTRLAPGWHQAAHAHIAAGPARAGWFRFALDSDDPRARRLERLVAWRCRVLALPYGDQGLLIHRDLLRTAGGMQPLPLMEDVDLAHRLGRGRLAAIDAAAVTSARKWQHEGWLCRSVRNQFCLALYLVGVPPHRIVRLYG
ncbi:MAG: TIGR04283 family arsenosugar biosynthesis glycosyltransferase [Acetobacteraceae bacterium]|nr:TIGR04283 family arsenosugar biosynthesis glycosyltransferase [Acetobacteraceae bacterium]